MSKNYFLATILMIIVGIPFFAYNKIYFFELKTNHLEKSSKLVEVLPPSASISGSTEVCRNDTPPQITFTGSGGTRPYRFTYSINAGATQTIATNSSNNSVSVNVNTSVVNSFVYRLISVRDGNDETTNLNATATVVVSEPRVDFSFNSQGACSGTVVNFTSTVTGNGPFTYSWSFGDGTTSNSANPTHAFEALGCGNTNFNVTLTATDGNGCANAITKAVSVRQKPELNFVDVDNPFNPFNNCGNNTTDPSFTINVDQGTISENCINSLDIDWGDGSPIETNVTFPLTHTYTQLGSFNMDITGNGSNCDNTVTYLIKNSSNPTGSLVSPGNTVNLCLPVAPLGFAIGSWGINPPDTNYTVEYGDGLVESYSQSQLEASTYYNTADPSNSQDFPIPHTYTESSCPTSYYVRLDVTTSCGQTNLTAGPIIILKKPEAGFEDPPISCVNTPVQFVNTSIEGYSIDCSINDGYFWDFGDSTTSTEKDPTHTYTSPGTYKVSLYAQNSCGITNTVVKDICIEPILTPVFTLNTNNGCTPLNVATTNTTDLNESCGNETYLWEISYSSGFCGTAPEQWRFTSGTNENSVSPSLTLDTAGIYILTLTTTNTCGSNSVSQTIEVKQPPTNTITNIGDFCDSASIDPTAIVNSCAPLTDTPTYNWSFPGGTPATANTLDPGTIVYSTPGDYQISFSVTNSCGTTTDTEDFSVNPIPSITNSNLTETICSGTETTEINLISDLTGTTFTWSATAPAGVTGFTASGSTSDIPAQTLFNSNTTTQNVTYTITPSLNGCDGTSVNLIISVDPAPEFTSQPQDQSICLNGTLNPLSVNVNGPGIPNYQWYSNTTNSNSGGTPISGATAASYTPPNSSAGVVYYYCLVSFSSGAGCNEITSSTARIEIVDEIQIDTQPKSTESICNGGDINTALSVVHSGGTGNITYQWYSNTTNSNSGGTAIAGANSIDYTPPTFNTLGNYYFYIIITPDANGCSPAPSEVAEVIVVDDPNITGQPILAQTLCQGIPSEELEVLVEGGLGSIYDYQWYSNTTNTNSGGLLISGATNPVYTPPTNDVGTLYFYVEISQPGSGCFVVSNLSTININPAPIFTLQPQSDMYCSGDSLTPLSVSYSNGVGLPAYQWYSNTVNDNTSGTAIPGQNSASINPPSDVTGTVYYYAVITFSSGGCTQITSNTAEITISQTPNISNTFEIICSGDTFIIQPDNTEGDIVPIGATYTWGIPTISPAGSISGSSSENTPQNNISQTLINSTTSPAEVAYTVTPTSGICDGSTFEVFITVNPSIRTTSSQTNSTCYLANSGSLEISISGGIPFASGNPYLVSWTGPNGYTNTDEGIFNLEPGNYILNITDEGGCPFSETFTITEPDELIFSTIDFNPETISCYNANDGAISIEISGGTTPYTYNWTRNSNPFATVQDLSNIGPGDYEVTVIDANNCSPITESFSVIEPPELQVSLENQVDIICFGEATGEINISTIGGRPIETSLMGFDYDWTGPNGFISNQQNLSSLFAGTYNLKVTDKSNCTDTLEVILNQTDEIIIDVSTTEIECYGDNNGSIIINNISGGNVPYSILWSNLGSGMSQDNLSAGTYIITVTDSTNCTKEATVIIDEAPIFTINPDVTNVSCFGENDARIVLNLEGGIAPVTLVWDDNPSAGLERNNIGPGTYTVTITDGTPCVISEIFTITEPDALNLTGNTTDALDCNDANSGAINLIITGGTLPLSYSWSNGATTEDLNNIPPGNYTITVADANNCEIIANWTINRFDPLTITIETITDFDCEARTVSQSFTANITGGIPPYIINWSSGEISGNNGEIMNTSQDGLVIIDVEDSQGCITNLSYNVDIPVLGDADFSLTSIGINTFGFYSIQDPMQFTNSAIGDFINVSWDFGDGNFSSDINPEHTYVNEGTYTIIQTITYPFGCVYTKALTIVIEKGYSLIIPNAFTPNGDSMNAYFTPESIALINMEFNIYNTWGSLIYSEKGDDLRGWDGKINSEEAENGNYYFTLSAQTFYGKTITRDGAFVSIK